MKHAKNIRMDRKTWNRENVMSAIYRLFWIYVICGVAGFVIETVWCWIDFQEFTSRTSNLFFPISCVWGVGGVVLYLTTLKNHWNNGIYIFAKCTLVGTVFEFLCGYLGEHAWRTLHDIRTGRSRSASGNRPVELYVQDIGR